jgi:Na+:H+ antiporter, NhaA family
MATPLKKIIRKKIIYPLKEFMHDSRAVGITLLICTTLSLIIANTSAGLQYIAFWNNEFSLPGPLHLPHSILHYINDLLMAGFFFLVGMEIKRELLEGELASFKKAVLPAAGAIGGMLVPALIYVFINRGTQYHHGWGIPMATDIAFSLGVASMLGKRVPVSLKIFLMALAIIDDLGAILVIAIFYGGAIVWFYIAIAFIVCIVLGLLNYFKKSDIFIFIIAALIMWYCIFNSGIHATIAGVALAIFIPVNKLQYYEGLLHDPVNFAVLPLFALANTCLIIPPHLSTALTTSLSWGVILGLLLGKPVGITLFSWMAVKAGLAEKPFKTTWLQFFSIGILAGIGFTMSIFITMLAFNEPVFHNISKIAVLVSSVIAMVAGAFMLYVCSKQQTV